MFGIDNIAIVFYTMRLEYDANNNPIYIGEALPGSDESDSSWRIKKLTYDSNNNVTNIKWAGGTSGFIRAWSNRSTYSYS